MPVRPLQDLVAARSGSCASRPAPYRQRPSEAPPGCRGRGSGERVLIAWFRTWFTAAPDNAPPVPQDNRARSAEAAPACAPVPSRRTGCRVLRHVRAGIRRSQPDVQIWAPVLSTSDGIMPVCLYLHGRTSWGNWPEKFRFRIVLGFSKQARKVPMRNWPAHARELHRSDVEGSEATRHVGPPRVGVTGACRYSQPDCWPVRLWAIRKNMLSA